MANLVGNKMRGVRETSKARNNESVECSKGSLSGDCLGHTEEREGKQLDGFVLYRDNTGLYILLLYILISRRWR
jgi:hypothetical protein